MHVSAPEQPELPSRTPVEETEPQNAKPSTPTCDGIQHDDEQGWVINMVQVEEEMAWDSEADSEHSSTSTPAYRSGNHQRVLENKARNQLQEDAKSFVADKTRPSRRGFSVQILADARFQAWPQDNVCLMEYRPGWTFKQWIEALTAEIICISCSTVILYLERVKDYEDVPPIKNPLQTICKIIRQHKKEARVFIANVLPRASWSPMDRPDNHFILLQAVCSINRILRKVHYLSIQEHLISKKGKVIKPVHKYFQGDNTQLPVLGCMVVRECFLREAGLKKYWFE